jgi:hypothetical protein
MRLSAVGKLNPKSFVRLPICGSFIGISRYVFFLFCDACVLRMRPRFGSPDVFTNGGAV